MSVHNNDKTARVVHVRVDESDIGGVTYVLDRNSAGTQAGADADVTVPSGGDVTIHGTVPAGSGDVNIDSAGMQEISWGFY